MESVKSSSVWATRALVALLFVFLALPFFRSLGLSLVHFEFGAVTGVFASIVVRAVGVTLLQATLSTALVGVSAVFVGVFFAFTDFSGRRWFLKCVDVCGSTMFVLPGLVVALFVLDVQRKIQAEPTIGLWPVVFAHVVMNYLWVGGQMAKRFEVWFEREGCEQIEAARSLGARGLSMWIEFLSPIARQELRGWLPLVFQWSALAFTTVLILGGGPRFSSPEVLLFYSLQNNFDLSRVLLLLLIQLGFGWVVIRSGLLQKEEAAKYFSGTAIATESKQKPFFASKRALEILFWLIAGVVLIPALALLAQPLTVLVQWFSGSFAVPDGFAEALSLSLGLALAAAVWASLFFGLLLACQRELRRNIALLAVLSGTFLAACWMGLGVDLLLRNHKILQVVVSGLGLALGQAPLSAFWIERRLREMPDAVIESAASLGANFVARLKCIVFPHVADLWLRVVTLALLGAMGEVAISSIFLQDQMTLALLGRRLAGHYDFSGSSLVLATILLVCGCLQLVLKGVRRWQS